MAQVMAMNRCSEAKISWGLFSGYRVSGGVSEIFNEKKVYKNVTENL